MSFTSTEMPWYEEKVEGNCSDIVVFDREADIPGTFVSGGSHAQLKVIFDVVAPMPVMISDACVTGNAEPS